LRAGILYFLFFHEIVRASGVIASEKSGGAAKNFWGETAP
jgi:hypothetical protein